MKKNKIPLIVAILLLLNGILIAQEIDELIPFRKGAIWGYVDSNKKISIPLSYDFAGRFNKGIAVVGKGDKFGIINQKNEILVPIERKDISNHWCGTGRREMMKEKTPKFQLIPIQNPHFSMVHLYDDALQIMMVDSSGDLNSIEIYDEVKRVKANRSDYPDIILCRKKNKWGMLDHTGQLITPVKYDQISYNRAHTFTMRLDSLWGLMDTTGMVITPPCYSAIYQFAHHAAIGPMNSIATLNGKKGLIDHQGKVLIPFEYERVSHYFNGLAAIKEDNKYFYQDFHGKRIPNLESDQFKIPGKYYIPIIKDNKVGIFKRGHHLIIPYEYDAVKEITFNRIKITKDKKHGVIDENQKVIIAPIYDYLSASQRADLIKIGNDKKYGLTDLDGKLLLPVIYDEIRIQEADIVLFRKGKLWGYYFLTKDFQTPLRYIEVDRYVNHAGYIPINVLPSATEMGVGLMDSIGNEVIPCHYMHLDYTFFDKEVLIAQVLPSSVENWHRKFGVIDMKGNTIVPFLYESIRPANENYLLVGEQEKMNSSLRKFTYLDMHGKDVFGINFEAANRFQEGLAAVKKNGKWGVINQSGQLIISFRFDRIDPFDNGLARVVYNGQLGYIDRDGKAYFSD